VLRVILIILTPVGFGITNMTNLHPKIDN
jgi:hypothetical protein